MSRVAKRLRILVACERSGVMQKAITALGHDCLSCDTSPAFHEMPFYHGSVFDVIDDGFDAMIGFPPCQYLTKAQMPQSLASLARYERSVAANEFFQALFFSRIPQVILENPPGMLNSFFRPPDQYLQPWYFGDPYRKEIGLWLKNSPPVIATCYNTIRKPVNNHCNSRMSSAERSTIRSSWVRFPLMAEAIAFQSFGKCL
jgi:hypothetical protein